MNHVRFNDSRTPVARPHRKAAATLAGAALAISLVTGAGTALAQDAAEPFTAADGEQVWRASVLNGANGIYVGPDGLVYATSVTGDEITVQDPETGEILDRIGPERGVNGPDDLVIAPDGTMYWTEILAGNVGMLRPDGTFVTQQVAPGVNPITLSDDGRLFVARVFLGNGLYELDPELVDPPQVLIEDLVAMNGMDFGPDGLLYGPLMFGGAVARVDVDADEPVAEIVAEGLRVPTAVKFDAEGRLHAADFAEGQIVRIDLDTDEREILVDIEGTLDNLTFDDQGRIFTAASSDGQILRRDTDGTVSAINEDGFTAPNGVTVAPDGTIWVVADAFSFVSIGSDNEPALTAYDRYDPPGSAPAGAYTISASGDELVTSSNFGNTVQVLDPATLEVREDIRTLAAPMNAIRHGEQLVAAQGGVPDGNNVVDAHTGEQLIGGLALPLGLASDGETLYVSDWATGIVHAVSADGESTPIAAELAFPEGLALDGDRLLVVEEGLDRVAAIDLATGEVAAVIEGLDLGGRVIPGAFPHGHFNGVAVGPDGSIVVTADGDNTVLRFPAS